MKHSEHNNIWNNANHSSKSTSDDANTNTVFDGDDDDDGMH